MILPEKILFIFLILARITSSKADDNPSLVGSRAPCHREGQRVDVDHIDKFNCYDCVCKHGFVECRKSYECPFIDGCYMLLEKTDSECCQRCKGCIHKGVNYTSHTEWTDSENPCVVFRCEAGVITQSNLQCHTPCSNPLPPEPGKCCPTCPECKINGQIATDDRDVISDDPCLECRCSRGRMTCSKKACPVLQCTQNYRYHPPGECCPRCIGTRSYLTVKNSCNLQRRVYKENEAHNIDTCTNCVCKNGTSVCKRSSCPILECAPDLQEHVPGSCCKKCRELEIAEVRSRCVYQGMTYEDGQSWNLTACSSCKCHAGMPSCAMTRCNVTSCAPGTQLVHATGECCGKCVEVSVEGTCMVFGDPHYKTFDGRMYTFRGLGKYQFVTDCSHQTFTIRVANDYTNRTHRQIKTRRVAVRYGDLRLNLQQKSRVKSKQKRLQIPFKNSKVRIEKHGDNIHVFLSNGVKIFWSGGSFLEVTVPATFKNKLCGLCGNFNDNIMDDLKNRKGRMLNDTDVADFGSSWCVGSKRTCTRYYLKNRQNSHLKSCNTRTLPNPCKLLSSRELFGECESKLYYKIYYKTCKEDLCKCPNGKCHCDSFLAYARECERLGVVLPNWKKLSLCHDEQTNKMKNNHNRRFSFSVEDIERLKRQRIANRTLINNPIPIH